jgi:predicted acylesterase/phospholipase RssA
MWRALVLSSGGVLGEFQVGALQTLRTNLNHIDLYCGAGVGALNTTLLAMQPDFARGVDSVLSVWDDDIKTDSALFTTGLLGIAGGALRSLISTQAWVPDGAVDPAPLRRLIERHADWASLQSKTNWAIATLSLTDGHLYPVSNNPGVMNRSWPQGSLRLSLASTDRFYLGHHFADFIQAAAAVPIMFPPVDVYGHRLCEAGIRDYAPVALACAGLEAAMADDPKLREAEVIVIDTSGQKLPERTFAQLDSGLEIALRSLQVMVSEMAQNDLELGIARLQRALPSVRVRVLKPEVEFEGFTMDFGKPEVRTKLRAQGAAAAQL